MTVVPVALALYATCHIIDKRLKLTLKTFAADFPDFDYGHVKHYEWLHFLQGYMRFSQQ